MDSQTHIGCSYSGFQPRVTDLTSLGIKSFAHHPSLYVRPCPLLLLLSPQGMVTSWVLLNCKNIDSCWDKCIRVTWEVSPHEFGILELVSLPASLFAGREAWSGLGTTVL